MATVSCSGCGKSAQAKETKAGNLRTPKGWKKIGDEAMYCPGCKKEKYLLRAVTFPVASVIGGEWKEFLAALRNCWARSTRLANWAMRQLVLVDNDRRPGQEKIEPMTQVNLYKLWQQHCERGDWQGATVAANSIFQSTDRKYRKLRFKIIWTSEQSLPRFKYPVPYPVHNQGWQPDFLQVDGKIVPVVTCNLDGRKWVIRLRGGHEMRRQLASFTKLVNGQAMKGELAIYRIRGSGSHRRSGEEKQAGGGQSFSTRIMAKMVALLPREEKEVVRTGALEVRTARNCLLVAVAPNREKPWLYHANHMRHWVKVYQWQRQNMADDSKAVYRPLGPAKLARYAVMANKHNNRMSTFCHQTARAVVDFAVRCRVSEIVYDNSDKRYVPEFPWAKLAGLIAEKCHAEGLVFTASEEVVKEENGEKIDVNNVSADGCGHNQEKEALANN